MVRVLAFLDAEKAMTCAGCILIALFLQLITYGVKGE